MTEETPRPLADTRAMRRRLGRRLPAVPQPPRESPILSIDGEPLSLGGLYRGASLFLVLSGPSLAGMDLTPLARRGIATMGVNNSPAIWRPTLWTYVDRPYKFHEAIWRDPGVLKFVPRMPHDHLDRRHWRVRFRRPDGALAFSDLHFRDCPGVLGYRRNANFDPRRFLSEPSVCYGNSAASSRRNGRPRCLDVMFAALKLAYVLGFRCVYLLGADFSMSADRPYAFEQAKTAEEAAASGYRFRLKDAIFHELRPHFDAAGFRVVNATPGGNLAAFERMRFADAIEEASGGIPQDPLDTAGWYSL